MHFVKVNYHLNKKFFVEDFAYKKMIAKTLKGIKGNIKVKNLEIVYSEKNNSFAIFLTIKKSPKSMYLKIVNQIQREIEEKSQLLINTKPINIEIKFVEEQ